MRYKIVIICLLLLSSCDGSPTNPAISVPNTPDLLQTQTQVALPTRTPKPTYTPVPTRTVTPTPWPTLQPELAELEIADLMQNNDNCERPCFWGIYPNESKFDAAIAYLDTFMLHHSMWGSTLHSSYIAEYEYKEKMRIGLAIAEDNDLVSSIEAEFDWLRYSEITPQDWLAFRPDGIMKAYGIPSEILFALVDSPGGSRIDLIYFYDEHHFTIEYDSEYLENRAFSIPGTIRYCPLESDVRKVSIWLGETYPEPDTYEIDLTVATSLSHDEFYSLLLEHPENACIDLSEQALRSAQ